MPLETKYDINTGKFRVFDDVTGLPATNSRTGTDLDGGGHTFFEKAQRQIGHIVEGQEKQKNA